MPIPQFDVEFTKDGDIFEPAQLDAMLGGLAGVTDLLVVSHGWNNDKADAAKLYDDLLGNVDKLLDLRNQANIPVPLKPFVDRLRGRTFAAVRIFWPSKRFTDAELIPGGGAVSMQAETENEKALIQVLDRLKNNPQVLGGIDGDEKTEDAMEKAKKLIATLGVSSEARKEFVVLLRSILDPSMQERDDASAGFFAADAETLFANAIDPVVVPSGNGGGSAAGIAGGAVGLGDLLKGFVAGARRIANFATYYQMKARAGTVGSTGAAQMLNRIRDDHSAIRIHLAGHSFGGRLVTAAANGLPDNTNNVSMSLLQTAYSHNGLSGSFGNNERGFFRDVIEKKRISGPIIVTHTKNDKAVGIAYPLASRIAGQNASALGDENDPYGGMGRNGAQHTVEADNSFTLGLPGTPYTFKQGRVHNILSDVITDHGDVARIEVAYAVLSAAGAVGTVG
jgi:hypothetical protein